MARHGDYGMISYIGDKIGQLLKVLEKTGMAENTIVIFAADGSAGPNRMVKRGP